MGTVFSIAVRDPGRWDDALAEVAARLHLVDALFSTYRPTSEISRLRSGSLGLQDADPLIQEVLARCERLRDETGGFFTADLPGGLDPSGLVKGWAVERAGRLLRTAGSRHHAVNGGGDVQLAGEAGPGRPWRVGISDPADRARLLAVVVGNDLAVATSGTSERGHHIVDPHTRQSPSGLASVTVVGASLTLVDAFATAAFAMGSDAIEWIASRTDVEGFVVAPDGTSTATAGFPGTLLPG